MFRLLRAFGRLGGIATLQWIVDVPSRDLAGPLQDAVDDGGLDEGIAEGAEHSAERARAAALGVAALGGSVVRESGWLTR